MTQVNWKLLIAEKTEKLIGPDSSNKDIMGPEKVTLAVGGEDNSPSMLPSPPSPQPITDEENPFAISDDETSAVDATLRAIDPDPSRLPLIANNESPKAYAALFSVALWEEQEGAKELAELDRGIGNYLLMFGASRRGKENRITKVLETLKAQYQMQVEGEQLDKKSRLLGR